MKPIIFLFIFLAAYRCKEDMYSGITFEAPVLFRLFDKETGEKAFSLQSWEEGRQSTSKFPTSISTIKSSTFAPAVMEERSCVTIRMEN